MGQGTLRVYQEDWYPFQALPDALAAFTQATGIPTELSWDTVGVGTIEHMFDEMIGSFTDPQPRYDVICTDEIILQEMARRGAVLDLAPRLKQAGMTLDHVSPATRAAVSQGDAVLGLPCVNVCSMLLCRRDLLEKHGLDVPTDWDALHQTAGQLQDAERRDTGNNDFYGFETRGAAGGGHAVWTIGSFLGSYGARWLDGDVPVHPSDAHHAALSVYRRLIAEVCPPDQAEISFVEMRRDYRSGRVGMIMDVGMEYAHVLAQGDALADGSVVAMVPAGPAGRAPNLYAPPWAIPARCDMPDEAFELIRFLTSDARLRDDGLQSNAVETSSLPVLYDPAFDRHFRDDLIGTVRASRAVAKEERPFSAMGIEACTVVGDAVNAMVRGSAGVEATLATIERGLTRLHEGG